MRFDLGEGGVAAIASQAQILHWVEQQKAAWRTVPSESKSSSEAITDLTSRIAELGRVIHKTVTAPTSLQAGTELADSIRYIRPILVDSPAGQKIVSAMIEDRIEDLKTLLSAPTTDGFQEFVAAREQVM